MLQKGDSVPHFEVNALGGARVSYSTIWQHRNLALVTISSGASMDRYVSELTALLPEFAVRNTECIITRDAVPGALTPGVLVADRWGEIAYVTGASADGELPTPRDLFDWVDYVQSRCPECEGESK